jgi:dipeptidyl aminopeptidase/acylaminoacyl peptidase
MKALDLSPTAPWRQRFRAASVAWADIAAANPRRGLVCTNKDGIYQLYAWDIPAGSLRQITDQPAGVMTGVITPDGQSILYLLDESGDEIGHFVRVPFAGGAPYDLTPNMPRYSSAFAAQSRSGRVSGFLCAGPDDGFLACVLSQGQEPRILARSQRVCNGPVFSQDGEITVIASTERFASIDYSLLAFDTQSGELLGELWEAGASIEAGPFSPRPGDLRLLATTTQTGFERPLIWNPRTGTRHDLRLEHIPGSIFPWDWSPDARKILLCQLYQARYQLYLYDLETESVTPLAHPPGDLGASQPGYFAAGGQEIWVTWQDASHPAQLVALEAESGALKRVLLSAGQAPAGQPFRAFEFLSENGDTVQGWVATPLEPGPYPVILHAHGGPNDVQTAYFWPAAQAWLDHGLAVCSINYHGSITFGREFETSIRGNLGDLEVQDLAAARQWLIDQHIARPDAVFLTGASYGGYLTLQAVGRRPELWAGGLASVAIADWVLMYADQAERLRGYQRALFGGTPQEVPEATRKSSPITYAGQVRAPLLVIQGTHDTRCPARQMQAYEARLTELGKSIHVHWFDAGHGSRAQEQQIEQQELMLRFVSQLLG